jgi:hypothetical protein
MKRIVRSDAAFAWVLGAIGGLAVGIFDAGPGVTYLIALGLGALGLGVTLGPDRVRLWRQTHGHGA